MRNSLGVSALYDITDWLNLTGGIEGYYDFNKYVFQGEGYIDPWEEEVDNVFWNDLPEIGFYNIAGYLQALAKASWGMNLTVGGRYEYHSQYGSAFAPRFGITQVLNDFHCKLLVSKAFRSPTIGALVLPFDESTADDPQLKPEDMWVQEIEAGYRINKNMFVTANLYNIMLNNSIGYFDIMSEYGTNPWGYMNIEARTGSWGAEAEYTFKHKIANVTANYSYYSNRGKEEVVCTFIDSLESETEPGVFEYDTAQRVQFNVPGIEGPYLAAPQHKVGLNVAVNVWKGLWVAPSAVLMSKTYGYFDVAFDTATSIDDETGETVIDDIAGTQLIDSVPAALLVNLFVTYKDLFTKGLDLSLGVYDLFGVQYPWIQPYNGYGAPIPGPSREFLFKLTYEIPAKR